MKTPTIHMNGDSQKNLLEEATNAMDALSDASDALLKITVNGRNFYPQGDSATGEAVEEFRDMMIRFFAIRDEVEQYAIAIDAGGAK